MTKLEVGKEYWIKGRVEETEGMYQYAPYVVKFKGWTSWMPVGIEAVEVVPEREKVTIPKEVADFINGQKNLEHGVLEALEEAHLLTKLDVINWLKPVENQEKFLKAWIYGYEIEKEPLYWVRNKEGKSLLVRGLSAIKISSGAGMSHQENNIEDYTFTEKEIKEYDERYWAFAVPVEEEDE